MVRIKAGLWLWIILFLLLIAPIFAAEVTLQLTNGKTITGSIVVINDRGAVLRIDGETKEFPHENLKNIIFAKKLAADGGGLKAEPITVPKPAEARVEIIENLEAVS